jgi:hypothetical protein
MQKRFQWKVRHGAALASVLWMIVTYTIWLRHFGSILEFGFLQSQMTCDGPLLDGSFFRAGCLHNAIDAYDSQYVSLASDALLVALIPVIALWVMLAIAYLWLSPDAPPSKPAAQYFSDHDWRARIEMKRSVRAA